MEDFHDGKIGIDYDLNKKTILGALITIYNRRWIMDADNNSINYTNRQPDTLVDLFVHEFHATSNYNINVNLQQTYKEGNKLLVNFDYMHYKDLNPVDYKNSYYDSKGSFLKSEEMMSSKTTPIDLWVAAVDYTRNLNKKLQWEAGAKFTISHFTNEVRIDRLLLNDWTIDETLSANWQLNENISAAYSSFNWAVSTKTKMKFGGSFGQSTSRMPAMNAFTGSPCTSKTNESPMVTPKFSSIPSEMVTHTESRPDLNECNSPLINFSEWCRLSR